MIKLWYDSGGSFKKNSRFLFFNSVLFLNNRLNSENKNEMDPCDILRLIAPRDKLWIAYFNQDNFNQEF